MKVRWKEKTFEELSTRIGDGLHGTPKYDQSGDYFFINGNNLNNGTIEIKERTKRVNEEQYNKHCKTLTDNTVLISINGTLGNVAFYNNEPIILGKSACYINFKDCVDKRFIKYHIQSPIFFANMAKESTGATIKNFSLKSMRAYKFPLPSLTEQKQIVALLDQAFTAIDQAKANIEKNIQNAKELFQSKLNEIFSQKGEGWEEKSLGEDCIVSMGQSPKGTSYNSDGVGTPLINGPVEFGPKPFSKTVMSKWTTKPTKLCEEGDLILCVRGSTTGRINIAGFKACIGRGVASIRYSRNQEWINFFIRCMQKNIYDLGTGSTFPNVSGKILSTLKFAEPISIDTQNELIKTMQKLDYDINLVRDIYEKKYRNLEELKKSILQKAFAGELTKDYSYENDMESMSIAAEPTAEYK